jgi:hypothetical protein
VLLRFCFVWRGTGPESSSGILLNNPLLGAVHRNGPTKNRSHKHWNTHTHTHKPHSQSFGVGASRPQIYCWQVLNSFHHASVNLKSPDKTMIRHEDMDNGRWYSKMHKSCCCPTLCLPMNCLLHPCRVAVSRSKRRYREEGFDLDLAYIDDRIIVHGFPAIGIEHLYRNPRFEIRRFMDAKHPDMYKMYNFCCEPGRGYEPEVFYNRIERYPFKDHNTPPLRTMVDFAESVKCWLDQDPAHVVNMHCKAGKGRAGLMSCVALVRTGIAQSAKDAMDIYDSKRVTNNRGLTVTSQRKFVVFYEALWRKHWGVTGNIGDVPGVPYGEVSERVIPKEPIVKVTGIELLNANPGSIKGSIRVKIYKGTNGLPVLLYDSHSYTPLDQIIATECEIEANFKIMFFENTGLFGGSKKVLELLHSTLFMDW